MITTNLPCKLKFSQLQIKYSFDVKVLKDCQNVFQHFQKQTILILKTYLAFLEIFLCYCHSRPVNLRLRSQGSSIRWGWSSTDSTYLEKNLLPNVARGDQLTNSSTISNSLWTLIINWSKAQSNPIRSPRRQAFAEGKEAGILQFNALHCYHKLCVLCSISGCRQRKHERKQQVSLIIISRVRVNVNNYPLPLHCQHN